MLNLAKTDEQLISMALDGSQRSWVKLVKRYENLVYNYCLRMTRNSSEAMDMMQEVFLAVYRNLPLLSWSEPVQRLVNASNIK